MESVFWDAATVSFAAFFATLTPIEAAAEFAILTAHTPRAERRKIALRGALVAAILMLAFALGGDAILGRMGVSLAAMRAGGGALLLLIGIDMVFARESGAFSPTAGEKHEAAHKEDIAVFPLATPLIAGPGAMSAAVLLMADAGGETVSQAAVLSAMFAVLAVNLGLLLVAAEVRRFFGVTFLRMVTRVFGILLTALAAQFIFDGIAASGIF